MKGDLTLAVPVLGTLYHGKDMFYVVSMTRLADDEGTPLEGIGWLVTSVIPVNLDMLNDKEVDAVYDAPILAIGGGFLTRTVYCPKVIQVLNAGFVEEDDDEVSEMPENLELTESYWKQLLNSKN